MLLKTQIFEKNAIFPVKKTLAFFSRIIEQDKCQRTLYRGPDCILTSIVQTI